MIITALLNVKDHDCCQVNGKPLGFFLNIFFKEKDGAKYNPSSLSSRSHGIFKQLSSDKAIFIYYFEIMTKKFFPQNNR